MGHITTTHLKKCCINIVTCNSENNFFYMHSTPFLCSSSLFFFHRIFIFTHNYNYCLFFSFNIIISKYLNWKIYNTQILATRRNSNYSLLTELETNLHNSSKQQHSVLCAFVCVLMVAQLQSLRSSREIDLNIIFCVKMHYIWMLFSENSWRLMTRGFIIAMVGWCQGGLGG